ncbi:PAS domain S-box protein [Flavobacterium acetivorans]|uniref:PAS domain S-box protein n=1 Tax=Flavobacterium acetivorans TaxID=2893883 RepID=UPI001E380E7A|nr:PAS domain S-box protein [Flavobacterium sp. F-29]UFH34729.1 PAS domain S-box protein [Flavobacterium sp. F-29]
MDSEKKWSQFINWLLKKPKSIGFFISLFLSIIVFYIVSQQYQIAKKNEHLEMDNSLKAINQNIDQSLKNCYTSTLTLALTLNNEGIPEDFESISKKLLESNNSIDAVELVPNGVIRYVYPFKENQAALNLDILKSKEHQKEALKSITNKKMYFAGPIKLQQGGLGIVGRFPVYIKNKFWGFSAVIIKLDTLLKISGINSINKSKYFFQISKKNPLTQKEVFFLPYGGDLSETYYVTNTIPDGDWKLYLIAKNPNSFFIPLLLPATLGFILAALFGFSITLLLKKPAELQQLVNEQASNLEESEIKFKTIFDQASVGIAQMDSRTGNFIKINNKYCEMLGYTPSEMKNKNFQSVTHPEDLEISLSYMEKLKEGKIREYSIEKRYLTKSGGVFWGNLSISPFWEPNQKITTHISIVEDITLRKENEDLIQKSELRFKSLFNNSPVALWEQDYSAVKKHLESLNLINENPEKVSLYLKTNPDLLFKCFSLVKVIDVNKQCLIQYAPRTKEEILNNSNIIFEKESIPSFTKHLIAICKGQNYLKMDAHIKNPKGEIRDINLIYSVVQGYEETLERVIISTEDITDRKKDEKLILNSQQKIESLINTIDGIVWECDIQTLHFNFISKKVEHILGYTAEEWLASPTFWQDHIYADDRKAVLKYCSEKVSENLDHDFEYRMVAKNGTIVWLRDIVSIVYENNQAASMRGIMIDISKTKEIEKDLNNSFHLVNEQNKRLLNFSHIVSHNLRSHTSNISSIINLIETSESEQETKEMVQLLKSVSNLLNETITNLNEIVDIRKNTNLITEKLNLKQYINNALTVLSDQIKVKNVKIICTVGDAIEVNYNPAYLESILFNLISNAIRYSAIERNPTVSISCSEENNKKILKISDNGIGIDLVKNGDKIFGMYKTFSNNPHSKGIGLFITKNQIDAMGGKISVESEPNVGTTFKICIQ